MSDGKPRGGTGFRRSGPPRGPPRDDRGPPRGGGGGGGRPGGPRGPPAGAPAGRRFEPQGIPRVWQSPYGVLTENAVPGTRVYGEKLFTFGPRELRAWNPRRSKLAALLLAGTRELNLTGKETVLYLGAASGTTVSHLADILAEGRVIAVEKSARSFRDLLNVARARPNVLPVLTDAHDTDALVPLLGGGVDVVYQDIAQRDQDAIFVRASRRFLKPGGQGILMVKARSISVGEFPKTIYDRVEHALVDAGLESLERRDLAPWERDHASIIVRRGKS